MLFMSFPVVFHGFHGFFVPWVFHGFPDLCHLHVSLQQGGRPSPNDDLEMGMEDSAARNGIDDALKNIRKLNLASAFVFGYPLESNSLLCLYIYIYREREMAQ